jgi:hypothetical protein
MLKSVVNGQRIVLSTASLQAEAAPAEIQTHAQKCQAGRDAAQLRWLAAQPPKIKMTRTEQDAARTATAIADLQAAGGIVARGAWQTGTGNYKKARVVPVGAAEFNKHDNHALANVQAWFAAHPRAQRCVAALEVAPA